MLLPTAGSSIDMKTLSKSPIATIALAFLALLLILTFGVINNSRDYKSRGMTDELPTPISGAGVHLGVNVHLEQYNHVELTETLSKIKSAGIDTAKQSFYYNQRFDWSITDQIFSEAEKQNIQLVALLDGNPTDSFAPPTDPSDFASWAAEFAGRYGDQTNHYIIWDEPNLTSHWGGFDVNPAEYGALLALTAESIRAADPGAIIVAAPLAPTIEQGPRNLADSLFLQELYEAGVADSFDVVAGKPYGFNTGPEDRQVDLATLNFSRIILLREVMVRNEDGDKPVWAGNWGWNSLPADWSGSPSIWGGVDEETQASWTVTALQRARQEWPWMASMFLENWEPMNPDDHPAWGFSIAGRPVLSAIRNATYTEEIAFPGFHLADNQDEAQDFIGSWRFSPEFGADIGNSGDSVEFRFWGTDIGVRVRRADFHSRFYALVDGEPANELPKDDRGATLVLNSPDPLDDYLAIERLATNLEPGEHTLLLEAHRGSDQWALNGFTVNYHPPDTSYRISIITLSLLLLITLVLLVISARKADWGRAVVSVSAKYDGLSNLQQIALTSFGAALVSVTGWLTWGEQTAGIYRRLGDVGQLTLTAATAGLFYVAPSFIIYISALAGLLVLLYLRPVWGLALVAFAFPFFVKPKALGGYLFSPVELLLLITFIAFSLRLIAQRLMRGIAKVSVENPVKQLTVADWSVAAFTIVATLSLLFTERLDVATNEWRVLILEPVLFFLLMRWMKINSREMWIILDAFILGGVTVALIGLVQYSSGQNLITSEGGLMRLRSVYGSPNNVALYLGRIISILAAMILMGRGRRRYFYLFALLPVGAAVLLSYSKGALFLGLPASLLVILLIWRRHAGGRLWPWLIGAFGMGLSALLVALQIPALAGRLNPQGTTGFFRMNLWRSSINMFRDNPIFGVGLDNFLYAYRGRYIFDATWQEPNLNHPHNMVLDFLTRLGILGFFAGAWMFWSYFRISIRLVSQVVDEWQPIAAGLLGALAYMLAHGIVDHSFFLVDLAYAFFLLLAIAIWMEQNHTQPEELP